MSDEALDFCQLMSRVREGCPEAMDQVCRRYSDAIRYVIRRKLRLRLRAQYDSIDFVQAVWASVIGVPREEFTFDNPEDLIRYLARLATNKVINAYRHSHSGKEDLAREEHLEVPEAVPGREPTPSQNAIAGERLQQMIDCLTPGQRRVLALRRQGCTYEEIADRLSVDVKSIQRILRILERNLQV